MSKIHGKDSVVVVNGVDFSQFLNAAEEQRSKDDHDVTTFGDEGHEYQGGLQDGSFPIDGFYDNAGSDTPEAVLRPLLGSGTKVTILWQPDGAGSGKAQTSFSALLTSYNTKAAPDDMVMFKAEFKISGAPSDTAQA